MSASSRMEREMIATLLVSGSAPPMPSIWRGSGDPITASSTRSRAAGSSGRSEARKYAPFDVPPRIIRHGMRICLRLEAIAISPSKFRGRIDVAQASFREPVTHRVVVEAERAACEHRTRLLFLLQARLRGLRYRLDGGERHHDDA